MKARTAIAAAALLALAACGGGGGSGSALPTSGFPSTNETPTKPVQTEQPPNKAAPCSVAYWGDSISALTAPRLGKGLDVHLHAVVGGTAQAALPAFLQDPLTERFVVIEYGTNDANGGSDLQVPVRSMLDRVKAMGRTPVLTGLPHETAGNVAVQANFNFLLGQLAKEYGALWADWQDVAYAGASDLMPDGVHPEALYQQLLADRLTKAITDAAPECAAP